jgi:hypothetical protein
VGSLGGVALHQRAVAPDGVLLGDALGRGTAVGRLLGGAFLGAEEGRQRGALRAVGVEHALLARRALGDGAVAGQLAAVGGRAGVDALARRVGLGLGSDRDQQSDGGGQCAHQTP